MSISGASVVRFADAHPDNITNRQMGRDNTGYFCMCRIPRLVLYRECGGVHRTGSGYAEDSLRAFCLGSDPLYDGKG